MLTTGSIFGRTWELLRAYPLPGLVGLAALTVPGVLIDLYAADWEALLFVYGVSAMAAVCQYQVVLAVMRGERTIDRSGAGRVGSYIGLLIVTGIAISLGVLLLVLPGIYWGTRWSIAVPLVLGEGRTMDDAMRTSVERTRDHLIPIAVALTLLHVPLMTALVLQVSVYDEFGRTTLAYSVLTNMLTYGTQVGIWYCITALHTMMRRPEIALEEVFA